MRGAEFNLQGAAGTANSDNLRVRQAYLAFDDDRTGTHALAGQAWSLAALY